MIGAGSWSRRHLQAWEACEDAEVVVIYNRTRQRAEKLAERFSVSDITDDASEAIGREDIDIVSISMPHNMHFALSNAAVDAGKHVFCEKPLAMDYREAREMWDRAQKAGVKTGVQFNPRIDPGVLRIRELIGEGYVGQISHVELRIASDFCADPKLPMMWRFKKSIAGSGVLGDMGVYIIDTARWLVGEFAAVSGVLSTHIHQRPIIPDGYDFFEVFGLMREDAVPETGETGDVENEDEALFLATFESGATGYLRASRVNADQGTMVLGTDGLLVRDYRTGGLFGKRKGDSEFSEIQVPPRDPNRTILSHLVDNIKQDADAGPTFYDGMKNQAVIDAVLLSAEEHRWVQLASVEEA